MYTLQLGHVVTESKQYFPSNKHFLHCGQLHTTNLVHVTVACIDAYKAVTLSSNPHPFSLLLTSEAVIFLHSYMCNNNLSFLLISLYPTCRELLDDLQSLFSTPKAFAQVFVDKVSSLPLLITPDSHPQHYMYIVHSHFPCQ